MFENVFVHVQDATALRAAPVQGLAELSLRRLLRAAGRCPWRYLLTFLHQ